MDPNGLKRSSGSDSEKEVNVAVSMQPTEDKVNYPKECITFVNFAISKKTDGLKINRFMDLKNRQVFIGVILDRAG